MPSDTTELYARVEAALPDENAVEETLMTLPEDAWREAARSLHPRLPAFDVVVTPGTTGGVFAEALAETSGVALAVARGTSMTAPHLRSDHWALEQHPLVGCRTALVATSTLLDGLPELELAALVRGVGLDVVGIAVGVELTSRGGRSRLDMLSLKVFAEVQLAHTPVGLKIERRGAGGEILMPMP